MSIDTNVRCGKLEIKNVIKGEEARDRRQGECVGFRKIGSERRRTRREVG